MKNKTKSKNQIKTAGKIYGKKKLKLFQESTKQK
jgi:hypothetical protein